MMQKWIGTCLGLAGGFLCAVAVCALPGMTVKSTPTVLQEGASVRVTCRVMKNEDNRWVEWGIVDALGAVNNEGRQMDGMEAPITYESTFKSVPCGVVAVACRVTKANGSSAQVNAPLVVRGCDEPNGAHED